MLTQLKHLDCPILAHLFFGEGIFGDDVVVAAVKGKKPVIVVMLNGGAVAIDWLKTPGNSDAILEAFYPGKIGAGAIADILFGAYNPSGKLPYTIMPASFVNEVNFLDMSMTAGKGRTYRFYKGHASTFEKAINESVFLKPCGKDDLDFMLWDSFSELRKQHL